MNDHYHNTQIQICKECIFIQRVFSTYPSVYRRKSKSVPVVPTSCLHFRGEELTSPLTNIKPTKPAVCTARFTIKKDRYAFRQHMLRITQNYCNEGPLFHSRTSHNRFYNQSTLCFLRGTKLIFTGYVTCGSHSLNTGNKTSE